MTWLEALILGLVQGLTEFLPISSSAHLRIVGDLMGTDPGAAFTAITQIGTEAAVVLYFRRDIVRIIKAWFGALPVGPWKNTVPRTNPDARMGWYVIVGSVPIVVLGVLFQDAIDTTFRNLWITVVTLSVFGVLLGIADATSRRTKLLDHMTWRDAVLFGFAQALALIPGVSRSGGTITAGLLMGYTREAAARYSFLLAIPAVLGSGFYEAYGALKGDTNGAHVDWPPTIVATVIAFAVGLSVIAWLLRYLNRGSFTPFVVYRVLLGLLVLTLVGAGVLDPVSAVTSP